MQTGRRTVRLLLVLVLIGAPALVLRGFCVGRACDRPAQASSNTPFCRLPGELRRDLMEGFRDGPSPDVFAIAPVAGAVESPEGIWPGTTADPLRGPIVFFGPGAPAELPPNMSYDQIAPTIAEIIELDRPHPEVRSGRAVRLPASDGPPRLVVLIGAKGQGFVEGMLPSLQELADAGTATEALYGSKPVDAAAIFTTVGTGGLPRQHGITGAYLRDREGDLGAAWSREGAFEATSVIATLADDLDQANQQRASIAMVADAVWDRGLIGDGWYVDIDEDDFVVEPAPRQASAAAVSMLDDMDLERAPGLLAFSVDVTNGRPSADAAIGRVVEAARRAADGSVLFVIAGVAETPGPLVTIDELTAGVGDHADLVEGVTAGGVFLDQAGLARTKTSEATVVRALDDAKLFGAVATKESFADVFGSISVAFGRYC